MKISGASIIRNGVKFGYPFVESIKSALPICDEFVVGVGDSDDGTRAKIEDMGSPKIKIIDTVWDMSRRSGGLILSEKTNEVFGHCSGDWIFYIQSDEAADEKEFDKIRKTLELCGPRGDIDGIAFEYLHFYGSYFTVQTGRNWYKKEVRIIRNRAGIVSHGDAQGFRKDGKKITAVSCGAHIYHYGWARPPEIMAEKVKSFHKLWHDDRWIEENCGGKGVREYFSDLGNLATYDGPHPEVMGGLVNRDTEKFIAQCRNEYLKNRGLKQALKDLSRGLPLDSHRNFILKKI